MTSTADRGDHRRQVYYGTQAFLKMKKFDIARLQDAFDGRARGEEAG